MTFSATKTTRQCYSQNQQFVLDIVVFLLAIWTLRSLAKKNQNKHDLLRSLLYSLQSKSLPVFYLNSALCVCALYNNEMKARYCHQTHQSWAIKLTAFCRTSLGNELAKDFCFQNEIVCAIVSIFLDESFLFVYAIILTLLYDRFYFFISFFSPFRWVSTFKLSFQK